MHTTNLKNALLLPLVLFIATACTEPSPDNAPTSSSATTPHSHADLEQMVKVLSEDGQAPTDDVPTAKPITTQDGKIQLDWSHIHTKTPKADTQSYSYPIALDAQAVKNYAKQYQISDQQAQHSIVVGMAAPEALGKVLDQLDGEYRGHELKDGADMTLVIYVSDKVVGETQEYVFADKFGEGLSIPVVISPISQSSK